MGELNGHKDKRGGRGEKGRHNGKKGGGGEQRYKSTPSLTSVLDGSCLSEPRLGRCTPGEMEAVPTAEKARWAPVPVWKCAEYLAPSGLDPRTAQPVVSRHTDGAIPQPNKHIVYL